MNLVTRGQTRWNPFKEMDELHNRLNSLFGSAFGRVPLRRSEDQEENVTLTEWAPLVDITEDEKEYLIKADLPEVRKEDLSVKVENGVLILNGERKLEKEEKGKRYHRVERVYGSFYRSFSIPDDADGTHVQAEFKNGVLQIHIAKSEKAKPKTIDVKVS